MDPYNHGFLEGLPNSKGFNSIWVVVDRLTKYSHITPLRHPYTVQDIANLFLKHIFKLHSLPLFIISDKDRTFASRFWQELFHLQGVQIAMSTAYHPQTGGQTKVVNKTLENYLRCFSGDKPKDWVSWIPLTEWWYNSTPYLSTKMTPFESLYGYPPPRWLDFIPGTARVATVEKLLQN